MSSFCCCHLIALGAWEACVIGSYVAILAITDSHIGGKHDIVWVAQLAICGFFVVGTVALLSRRFGKIGGAIVGMMCGLLPSVLILTWVVVARPRFEEWGEVAVFAYMLAAPSGVGGALAGIICSRRKKASVGS